MDEWYNAVQAQVSLAKYPQETANVLHHDIFWYFLRDEEFVFKTINDSSVHLDRCSASNVSQLAKKLESFKATARHIKQVASDPQSTEINFMRHQQTDLLQGKCKKKAFKPQLQGKK